MTLHASAQFDKQGKLFWHYCKLAGWSNQGITGYLAKTFNATHFNALNPTERIRAITIVRSYAKKQETIKSKTMRQNIVALWRGHGYTIDELHDYMHAWGFGDSLRKCSLTQLLNIKEYCKTIIHGEQK